MSLGLAATLDQIEGNPDDPAIWGVYWTVAAAFAATVVSGLMLPSTRNPARFATVQVAIDVAIVTSLVYFSGGGESVFTFLYALVVLYGALVLDRSGVRLSAGLAAAGYAFVLFGAELGWLPVIGLEGQSRSLPVLGAYWGFYAGALLVLGMLANTLSAELRRTGAALDRRTHDLRRLRDLHLRTVESIGSGLLTVDDTGHVTSFNPEAERITGLSAAQAEGRELEELMPGATAITEAASARRGVSPGAGRDRIRYRATSGEELFLGIAASPLRGEDARDIGFVVIFQDVTEVVSMEQELRQSERLAAVGEMAARIAHEIRNPLASISGSVQILQIGIERAEGTGEETPSDVAQSEQGRLMGIVVREVDRLNDLIGDFLLYSRPAPIHPERVRLADLIEEVAEMTSSHTGDEIEVVLELDPQVEVMADPAQLKSVIWNLWINAAQAMESSGRLSARVHRVPWDPAQGQTPTGRNGENAGLDGVSHGSGSAVLEIEDTGAGIPPEDQDSIFEPFFTTKKEGTGLGLATVQRIVEQHGGAIHASSQLGAGTCFRVFLQALEGEQ
jgi:two-component system sensor histidine kinase PilS (NtrC family)